MSTPPLAAERPVAAPPAIKPLSLRGNFAWTTAGNVVYSLCSWLMLAVIAKMGSPVMVGQFSLALALAQPVMAFSQMNLSQVQATDARREFRFGDYLGLRLVTTGLALAVLAAMAAGGGYGRVTAWVIVWTALGLGFDALGDVVFGLLRQHERMDRIAVAMAAEGVLSLAGLAGGLMIGHSVVWAAAGSALASVLVTLGYDLPSAVLVLRAGGERGSLAAVLGQVTLPRPHGDPRTLGRLAWLALPLGTILALIALNNNISRYFLQHSLGAGAVGIFSALASFVAVGRLLMMALGLSATPRLARVYAAGDRAGFTSLVGRLLLVGGVLAVAAPVAGLLCGRCVLTRLYTPEYARHLDVLVVCLAGGGVSYLAGFVGFAITAARSFKVQAVALTALCAVSAASCAWLVPARGMRGAAESALLVSVAQLGINLAILRRVLRALPPTGEAGA